MEVVHKTLDILETFLKQEGEIGIAELANLSGVNISTAHRITADLVQRGYLRQRQKRGKYSIGIKLLEFNAAIQSTYKIGDIALPYLQKLSKASGEYSEIALLDSYNAVTVAQAEVANNLRISNIIGERLPLHATSAGKILLAYLSDEEREQFYKTQKLQVYTKNTLTAKDQLEKEVEKIKSQGFALDNQEYDLGVWAVGAPLFDSNKSMVASLSIAAPSVRMDTEKRKELACMVREYALDLSREIGYLGK